MSRKLLTAVLFFFTASLVFSQNEKQQPAKEVVKKVYSPLTVDEAKKMEKEADDLFEKALKRYGVKSFDEIRMAAVGKGRLISNVREILEPPDHESVNDSALGRSVMCSWTKNGRRLYVSSEQGVIDYVSLEGYTLEELNLFKKIEEPLRLIAKRSTWASDCQQAIETKVWTYKEKEFEGNLIGWKAGRAIFRKKNQADDAALDPKLFDKEGKKLLEGYFCLHAYRDDIPREKYKSYTITPKESKPLK